MNKLSIEISKNGKFYYLSYSMKGKQWKQEKFMYFDHMQQRIKELTEEWMVE